MDCSLSKRTVVRSDFCDLYEPLPDDLSNDIVTYWRSTSQIISDKEEIGTPLTPNEKFLKATITNIGKNDLKYRAKKCDAE